jgi:hypothetical protein
MRKIIVVGTEPRWLELFKEYATTVQEMELEIIHQSLQEGVLGKVPVLTIVDEEFVLPIHLWPRPEKFPQVTDGRPRRSKGDKHRDRRYRWTRS